MERRAQATDAINQSAKQGQKIHPQFQINDQVWLEVTHLKLHHQKLKLAPKHYGPFRVTKEISPVAYQIALPPSWGIHNVFHASLLSSYHETTTHGPNFSRPPPELIDGEEEYEVECIANHWHHGRSKKLQYLIKWLNYPEADSTWEPADQVHAPKLIKAYHRHTPLSKIKATAICGKGTCPVPPKPPNAPSAATSLPHHTLSLSQERAIATSFFIATGTPPASIIRTAYCTRTSAKTLAVPFTTPTAIKPCPISLSTWKLNPLKHHQPAPASHPPKFKPSPREWRPPHWQSDKETFKRS